VNLVSLYLKVGCLIKTVKARLLRNEMQHVELMVPELIQERYRKLVRKMTKEKKVASDVLIGEEERVYKSVSLSQKRIRALSKAFFMDTYQKLMLNKNAKELLCVSQKMSSNNWRRYGNLWALQS